MRNLILVGIGVAIVVAALMLVGSRFLGGAPRGAQWELKPPPPNALPVATANRLPGRYPVGSRIRDWQAFGHSGCDNYPLTLANDTWGEEGKLSVVVERDPPVASDGNVGFAVRIVNRTGATIAFTACDSRLTLVQEARDEKGEWCEIEALPQSSCGNSYHRVYLPAYQYWELAAPRYQGPIQTKMRFCLKTSRDAGDESVTHSAEFDGEVSPEQIRRPTLRVLRKALDSNDPKQIVPLMVTVIEFPHPGRTMTEMHPEGALHHLSKLGPAAKDALPTIHAAMTDGKPSVRVAAARAAFSIEGLKPEQTKTLLAEFHGPADKYVRTGAVQALAEIAPQAEETLSALLKARTEPDQELRRQAVTDLGVIGARADVAPDVAANAAAALAKSLRDPEWYVRVLAADSLGSLGARAKPAVAALEDEMKGRPEGDHTFVRCAAAKARWKVTGDIGPSLTTLIEILQRPDAVADHRTVSAMEVLQIMGAEAEPAIPALLVIQHQRTNRNLADWAANTLSKIDPDGALRKAK